MNRLLCARVCTGYGARAHAHTWRLRKSRKGTRTGVRTKPRGADVWGSPTRLLSDVVAATLTAGAPKYDPSSGSQADPTPFVCRRAIYFVIVIFINAARTPVVCVCVCVCSVVCVVAHSRTTYPTEWWSGGGRVVGCEKHFFFFLLVNYIFGA